MRLACVWGFLGLLVASGGAQAQSWFERLVMPGELAQAHAKLEGACKNCHVSFSQDAQSPLCVSCHKDIGSDLTAMTGFHGRAPVVAGQECRHCHTDHAGRDADIVQLDAETFDHRATDFTLLGAHRTTACSGCHATDKKFRAAPHDCVDCHGADAPHKGNLGRDCAACHTETTWVETLPFDHAKTEFALTGGHEKLACNSCHIGEIYADLPKDCVSCHRIQDVHGGRFGDKCETCHSPAKWAQVRFEHNRDTDFALLGKHEKLTCNACHTGNAFTEDLGSACFDCHRTDDPHKGQLGARCETCHTPDGWREDVAFDHDITRFPLIGLHVLVPCEECHLDATFHTAQVECVSCHAPDDAHNKALGARCETCHTPNGWAFWSFDHDRQTDFTLTGSHAGLTCSGCHTPDRADAAQVPTTCIACHAGDDVHRGKFGTQCAFCHSTTSFKGAKLRRN